MHHDRQRIFVNMYLSDFDFMFKNYILLVDSGFIIILWVNWNYLMWPDLYLVKFSINDSKKQSHKPMFAGESAQ